jgi:osmotically-inducible protein OsmY
MRLPLLYVVAALGLGSMQGCMTPVVPAVPGVAAGAGATVMVTAQDRRSAGAMAEDGTIEHKAKKRIDKIFKDGAKVSVTSYNRFALITGWAASEGSKMDIERIVGSIPNVKGIANEIVVSNTPAKTSDSDDGRITASVKYRFIKSPAFKAGYVKVITEDGSVYLMGLVTHAEADAASDIASTTAGVKRVVRVFEYID